MMKKSKQLALNPKLVGRSQDCFGGSLLKGNNPKTKRPLDSKLPIHLVLKANRGQMRLPKNFTQVNRVVGQTCRKHGVSLYKYANVGNDLHMLIKIPRRPRWSAFIRELTGRIAQQVRDQQQKFWRNRPFTRVVRGWRKAFQIAKQYIYLNELEAEGRISRTETKTLKDLRAIWSG